MDIYDVALDYGEISQTVFEKIEFKLVPKIFEKEQERFLLHLFW